MGRIELRHVTFIMQDGLSGVCEVNDVAGIAVSDVDVDIDACVLNTTVTDQVPVGARFTAGDATVHTVTARTPSSGTTTNIVFTPAATSTHADGLELTFLPQRLVFKIGEGDFNWSEANEYIYDRDRGILDDVREGDDQPMSIDTAFTFEYYTATTGNPPTPSDALKGSGEASEWVSSASDQCQPYAIDLVLLHCVPCGTDEDQEFLFPDFRADEKGYAIGDGSVSLTGQCNATEPTVIRSTNADC